MKVKTDTYEYETCSAEEAEENAKIFLQEMKETAEKNQNEPSGFYRGILILMNVALKEDDMGMLSQVATMYHARKDSFRQKQHLSTISKTVWHPHVRKRALALRKDHPDFSASVIDDIIQREGPPEGVTWKLPKFGTYGVVLEVLRK
jgi:hypothetical protein